MKPIVLLLCAQIFCGAVVAQKFSEIPVWSGGAPESNGITDPEVTENDRCMNISEAVMYVYLPEKQKNTGAAVIICPGGGYARESIVHEGHDFAKWLIERGVAGIVLKYRLPNQHHAIPLSDAQRAIRIVRSRAGEWDVNPSKIGIAGFSAGGHLAATAGTHFDTGNTSAADPLERLSSRPDFLVLFYPVVTMKEEFTHMGSRTFLIGQGYKPDLVRLYSNEDQVTPQTPPVFIVLSDDDRAVLPRNSIEFYTALKEYGVPASLHIIPFGGHGWGTNPSHRCFKEWSVPLESWLTGMITK
ncbi:MAG: alpha/beta hydrolase [Bacteroidales bacterium]|jgi:acetyl esterase/lipase|nr:alpha/beta hydrolase [Bacteroidales bacterium]